MNTTRTQIEKFIHDIHHRNRREIIVGCLMLLVFGFYAVITPVGSLAFVGIILILLAILFVNGMLWFVASLRGGLNTHPVSDVDYWKLEMQRQAKLLHWVPFWYLAPFIPGYILMFWPVGKYSIVWLIIPLALIAAVFGFVAWLNMKAASELEQLANSLVKEPTNENINLLS